MLEFGVDTEAKEVNYITEDIEDSIELENLEIEDFELDVEDIGMNFNDDFELDLSGELNLDEMNDMNLEDDFEFDLSGDLDLDDLDLTDIGESSIEDFLKTHVSLPPVTKDYFKGKYTVDMMGLNPTVLLKEDDMELIGVLLNLVDKQRVQAFLNEMKIFKNHIVKILTDDPTNQTEESLEIYRTFDAKIRDLEAVNKRFRYLGISSDFNERDLRHIYERATNGKEIKEEDIYFVYKSIEIAINNPLKDLLTPNGELHKRALEYNRRNYNYTDSEMETLTMLGFPEIYGNEALVKEMSHILDKMANSKEVDHDTKGTKVEQVLLQSNIIPKFHNAYLSMKRGYAKMKYTLDTVI